MPREMTSNESDELSELLEKLSGECGVSVVLDSLVDVCDAAAERLRGIKADPERVRDWERVARRVIVARDDAKEYHI